MVIGRLKLWLIKIWCDFIKKWGSRWWIHIVKTARSVWAEALKKPKK